MGTVTVDKDLGCSLSEFKAFWTNLFGEENFKTGQHSGYGIVTTHSSYPDPQCGRKQQAKHTFVGKMYRLAGEEMG